MVRYNAAERRGALPSRLVAAVAVRVRYREGIVVSHMAVGAGGRFACRGHLVRTRQGPARGAVIERRRGPHSRGMARRAVRRRKRRSGRRVRRVVRRLPVCQVAARVPAVRREGRQAVVVADVAGSAGRHLTAVGYQLMRVCQRKARGRVVEGRIRPQNRVMAGRALRGREACRDVIRHIAAECRSTLPSRLVAAVAIRVRCRESIVVPHVAISAGCRFARRRHLVRTHQGPARSAVVEGRGGPRDGAVTCRAVRRRKRRSGRRVRGIIRRLPGRQVAARIPAVRRRNRQRVVIVDVAIRAGRDFTRRRHLVRIGQRETRRAVIKGCTSP